MNELEREFIAQSATDLNTIFDLLRENKPEILPEKTRHELFRKLHTIKGTAQTFGFSGAGSIAHSLENIAIALRDEPHQFYVYKEILTQGIELLIKSFEQKAFVIPQNFADKISLLRKTPENVTPDEDSFGAIPHAVIEQLSKQEKLNLRSELDKGKYLSVLEIGFDPANFAAEFKTFRESLSEKGEVIATLPCRRISTNSKIRFQIIFTGGEPDENLTKNSPAEVVFSYTETFAYSLQGVLAKVVGHGKNTAKTLGKNIRFVILADDFEPSPKMLKLIFDLLLHLVGNAVSHAIAEKGQIEIDLKARDESIVLRVSDNGKGLDVEKIKAVAIEKNPGFKVDNLSGREILELIFQPEFSTAETLTKISGRGIGLDVVKNLVETARGKINVTTKDGEGTIFEVIIPEKL